MSTESLLRDCYLCKDLSESELEDLRRIGSMRKLKKGEILFFEGDEATGFFVLLSGRVRVYKASPDGKEYTLHIISPGQMFAEAAIFGGSVFPANCIAMEDSTVSFFPRDGFISLITGSPQISLKMIIALSRFVREFNQQIESLSLKEVSARLASYLLRASEIAGTEKLTLETTKSELATSLGTISETLSRNLRYLRDLGVVRVDGKTIEILDRDRLESIADGEKN
jgi:CRP/FNR family transcriptional regulator